MRRLSVKYIPMGHEGYVTIIKLHSYYGRFMKSLIINRVKATIRMQTKWVGFCINICICKHTTHSQVWCALKYEHIEGLGNFYQINTSQLMSKKEASFPYPIGKISQLTSLKLWEKLLMLSCNDAKLMCIFNYICTMWTIMELSMNDIMVSSLTMYKKFGKQICENG